MCIGAVLPLFCGVPSLCSISPDRSAKRRQYYRARSVAERQGGHAEASIVMTSAGNASLAPFLSLRHSPFVGPNFLPISRDSPA